MQKWEYGTCRIWGSYLLAASFPPEGVKEFARMTHDGRDIKGQTVDAFDYFNKRGEEGWEFVAMTPITGAPDPYTYPGVRVVFKRPKAG